MCTSNTPDRPSANSYWVVPGRFAAGEYPGAWRLAESSARIKSLLEAGIDHFIDLTHHDELFPYSEIAEQQARQLGRTVGYERHPVDDASIPHSPEDMAAILDAIDIALNDGKTVYLHCWGGVGRTGTVVGCWLVRHGRSGEEALRQVAEWWQGVEKAYRLPHSPETTEQQAYVCNWSEPAQSEPDA